MNKKTISLIIGGLIILAFFLPYISFGGLFKISGFNIVTDGKDMTGGSGSADRFVMLLAPIAGILLIVGALSNSILPRPVLGVLALVGTLYPVIRGLMEAKGEGMGQLFNFLGIGFWLSLIGSIAVFAIPAIAPDRPKS